MPKGLSHTKSGFSLIELLVAVSVFLVFFTMLTDVTVNSSKEATHAGNTERATQLAEEALEASRNIRDADFANLVDGTYGLTTQGGQYSFAATPDTTSIFTRTITITPVSTYQKKVDVTVTWSDKISTSNSVAVSSYLTNWKKITPQAGLTISKTVINHGGTKVASDFAPFMVGTSTATLGVALPLNPGTYTVTETTDPNYTLTFSGDCNSSGVVTLAQGDAKVCTLTNEEKIAQITVSKTVINYGGTKTVSDFAPYKVGATTVTVGVPTQISAGTYTVTETSDPSYTATFSGDCSAAGSVTIALGQSKTCSITNEQIRTIPSVTTSVATAITKTTASSGGTVTSDGGASVTARGVVWSTSANPTISLSTKTTDGTGTGSFTSSITGLTCNTLYNYRAYATNSIGTAYGSNLTFTTGSCVTFVAASSSAATTVPVPAHVAGDLLLMFAFKDGNTTAPSLPSGWTTVGSATGANSSASRLAYRIATSTNDPSGTWTNASQLVVHVYRGANSSTPIGSNADTGAVGTVVSYPGLTLVNTSASWVAGFAGHRSTNTNIQNPPAGMVNRTSNIGAGEVAGHDTNGTVSSWSTTTVTVSGKSDSWRARTVEILSQ